MALFITEKQYEIREPIDSRVITQLRGSPAVDKFKAFSLKYRHPKLKNKFSIPSFCVTFSKEGARCSEIASSLDALDTELTKLYF